MSIKAVQRVLEIPTPMTTGERLLLLVLSFRADHNDECFPSLSCLERDTGLSARQVRRTLRSLEEKKLITSHRRVAHNGREKSSLYRLTNSRRGDTHDRGEGDMYDRGEEDTHVRGEGDAHVPPITLKEQKERSDERPEGNSAFGGTTTAKIFHPNFSGEKKTMKTEDQINKFPPKDFEEIVEESRQRYREYTQGKGKFHPVRFWLQMYAAKHGIGSSLSAKDQANLKYMFKEDEVAFCAAAVVAFRDWTRFTIHAVKYGGAFNCPAIPDVGFFKRYQNCALALVAEDHKKHAKALAEEEVQSTAPDDNLLTNLPAGPNLDLDDDEGEDLPDLTWQELKELYSQ